jgi:hypothetical protein
MIGQGGAACTRIDLTCESSVVKCGHRAFLLSKWSDLTYGLEDLGVHNEFNATIYPGPNNQPFIDRLKAPYTN